jgi:riboflavin transporter FmnP
MTEGEEDSAENALLLELPISYPITSMPSLAGFVLVIQRGIMYSRILPSLINYSSLLPFAQPLVHDPVDFVVDLTGAASCVVELVLEFFNLLASWRVAVST